MSRSGPLSRRRFLERTLRAGAIGFVPAGVCLSAGAADQAKSDRWQIGCYTRPWDKFEYRVALDAIAEAGFKHVGLMTAKSKTGLVLSVHTTAEEAARVDEEVRKRGLKVVSVYGGGIPVEQSLEAGIAGLRRLIDACAACDAGNLMMGGVGDEKLYGPYYKAIAECCDYAAEKGIGISVKPHGGLNATGPQCRKAVEVVGHKNFGVWYDPGNIYYYSDGKLDPADDCGTVDGLVVGMCVKDYVHPKNVMVTPGTGQVDFARVLGRLNQGGFVAGPLIVECLAQGDREHLLAEAKKAREFLDQLIGQEAGSGPAKRRGEAGLQAGVAAVDITPPIGYRMSGYFSERLSTAVSNPLYAKAVVLEQGPERAAFVSCDIIGLSLDVSSRARAKAEQATGIPAENILIAATHTHTGPLYFGALRNHFHKAAVAAHGHDPCEKTDYPSELVDKIVEVIRRACEAKRPARLRAGVAQQHGLSFNRRFHMNDGMVRFNPGVLNPDIVRPAGPIDPAVGIVLVQRVSDGAIQAGVVNFALHLDTVGGTEYAADYPYYVEQGLRARFGEQFVLLYGTGTCGDINHIDVTKRERLKTEHIGRTLAATVAEGAGSLAAMGEPALAMAREVVEVPLQQFNEQEIAKAREDIQNVGTQKLTFLEQVKACKILACTQRGGGTIGLEVQVLRLSQDTVIVGLPGEVFVDLGLAIKKASPFATTLVVELCQDAPGYIPTRKAFSEGSYETVNSRIMPGGGETLVEAAVRLLKSLHAGTGQRRV